MSRLDSKVQPTKAAPTIPELGKVEFPEEDSLQFLWAVSYCDLLMVLMSFFILFFQMSDTDPADQSRLKEIILSLKKENLHDVTKSSVVVNKTSLIDVFESVSKALESQNVTLYKDIPGKSLVVDLDANLYPSGTYEFPKLELARLERILNEIKPFSKDVFITFVGHADEAKVTHSRNDVIDSNLVLSNLRATRAVEIALKMGFNPKDVTGQGAGEFSRNTRSLSIKISERRSL